MRVLAEPQAWKRALFSAYLMWWAHGGGTACGECAMASWSMASLPSQHRRRHPLHHQRHGILGTSRSMSRPTTRGAIGNKGSYMHWACWTHWTPLDPIGLTGPFGETCYLGYPWISVYIHRYPKKIFFFMHKFICHHFVTNMSPLHMRSRPICHHF